MLLMLPLNMPEKLDPRLPFIILSLCFRLRSLNSRTISLVSFLSWSPFLPWSYSFQASPYISMICFLYFLKMMRRFIFIVGVISGSLPSAEKSCSGGVAWCGVL